MVCPYEGCKKEISEADFRDLIDDQGKIDRLLHIRFKKTLDKDEFWFRCPTNDCTHPFVRKEDQLHISC